VTDLLRTQKNAIFEAIRAHGHDPGSFVLENTEQWDGLFASLSHKASRYRFGIKDNGSQGWILVYSPADDKAEAEIGIGNWPDVMTVFDHWLDLLDRETNAPDLWADYFGRSAGGFVTVLSQDDDGPFSAAEREEIAIRLESVRVYLVQQGISGAALADSEEKLDYLAKAVDRLSRRDWKSIALSVAFQISLQAAFAPEQAKHLFEIMISPVRLLFGG
jgi:hypothetical protein